MAKLYKWPDGSYRLTDDQGKDLGHLDNPPKEKFNLKNWNSIIENGNWEIEKGKGVDMPFKKISKHDADILLSIQKRSGQRKSNEK